MSSSEIRQAYRHLYRSLLQVVRYTQPGRSRLRDHLRSSFGRNPASAYSAGRIAVTLEFLGYAERQNGLEHMIVKNLVHTLHERRSVLARISSQRLRAMVPPGELELLDHAEDSLTSYWETLDMLGKSMGMAVR